MVGRVAIIGECMLELSSGTNTAEHMKPSMPMTMSYGGDTLNSAVYMSRLGVQVEYVTGLGSDNLSSWMLRQWEKEGVGCQFVERFEGQPPGLYLIELSEDGERSFMYWRDQAPVRKLFSSDERATQLFEKISEYEYVYLSGITLGIFDSESRARLISQLREYRNKGGKVIFDSNYREKLWRDPSEARDAYFEIYQMCDIALPTYEDEMELFGDETENQVISRIISTGTSEVALKMGERGCLVANRKSFDLVSSEKVEVVDTTSAGDSFNAAYISARLHGDGIVKSARAGHRLAAVVIQHRGALIDQDNMPEL